MVLVGGLWAVSPRVPEGYEADGMVDDTMPSLLLLCLLTSALLPPVTLEEKLLLLLLQGRGPCMPVLAWGVSVGRCGVEMWCCTMPVQLPW